MAPTDWPASPIAAPARRRALILKQHGAQDLELEPCDIEASKVFIGEGLGGGHDSRKENLAELIAAINERFGTDFDERDRLEAEKVQVTLSTDEELKTFAKANPHRQLCLGVQPEVQVRHPRHRGAHAASL